MLTASLFYRYLKGQTAHLAAAQDSEGAARKPS
jgi:hypothetical protein